MKMYFYYGVMGSSKTANALMNKFSFEEHGKKVLLLKPSIDNRDGISNLRSRIGLMSDAVLVSPNTDLENLLDRKKEDFDIIIVDEAQFLLKEQVDAIRNINQDIISAMCYGLKVDYMGNLFEGSKRLMEVSDSIREIKSMCPCGKKATMNARYKNGKIIYSGNQIDIGGDDKYQSLCYDCWKKGRLYK